MAESDNATHRPKHRRGLPYSIDQRDIDELIRISNRLRARSNAVQRAATRATLVLQDVLRRSEDTHDK